MSRPSGAAPDPFLPPVFSASAVEVSVGKTRSFPKLRVGENTGVFIVTGQSLAGSTAEGFYTPTNATKVDQINPLTGEMLVAVDPLASGTAAILSTQRATPFLRVADQLVAAGKYDRVILIPCARGGTTIAMWDAELFVHVVNAYRRALALGIPITAVLWQQGETDTVASTTQAAYVASFNSMRAKVVAAGCVAPWLLAKSTYVPGGVTSAPVRAAIASLVNGSSLFAGPDTDSLGSGYRYDDQHWNAAGNAAAAALWTPTIQAALP